ncbi:DUF4097 family beta strand repeat-containing protein [Dactylosporangium sp. CA-092794]|uniref:DUF4097 family beta strand repeat-containing protein n=1 Tax=Dactylosporangium sp. CA-092794 TaxID=3239929 RepID=UPI003D91C4EA
MTAPAARIYTASAAGPLMLELRLSAGSVRVVVEDRDRAEVTLTSPTPTVLERVRFAESYQRLKVHVPDPPPLAGGTVQVTGGHVGIVAGVVYGDVFVGGGRVDPQRRRRAGRGEIGVDVRLPLHSSVFVETVAAPVTCTGALLTATVHTTSGAIRLDTVAGPQLYSVSGAVTIANLIGIGAIETVSGDITVTATAPTELNAQSVDGDIRAAGPIRLTARTVSGRVITY